MAREFTDWLLNRVAEASEARRCTYRYQVNDYEPLGLPDEEHDLTQEEWAARTVAEARGEPGSVGVTVIVLWHDTPLKG